MATLLPMRHHDNQGKECGFSQGPSMLDKQVSGCIFPTIETEGMIPGPCAHTLLNESWQTVHPAAVQGPKGPCWVLRGSPALRVLLQDSTLHGYRGASLFSVCKGSETYTQPRIRDPQGVSAYSSQACL